MNIHLDLATAKSIASLINIAEKATSATPVLQQVRCTLYVDGTIIAVATDRYAVIKASYETENTGGTTEFSITHSMAKFIAGIKNGHSGVYLSIVDDQVIASVGGDTHTTAKMLGNYPPVTELITNWQIGTDAMPVSLSLSLLSRLAKIVDVAGKKVEDWQIELGNSDRPARPAPVRLTHGSFIALQQPKLITR